MSKEFNLFNLALDSKLSEKVYDDAISPSMKEASKITTDLVKTGRLILAPIQVLGALQDRFEHIVKKINQQVEPENRTTAESYIAGPILENLRYQNDDSIITECFINLLCRAVDKDRKKEAHPGFIKILENLSPDEALLIYVLSKRELEIVDTMDLDRANNQFHNRVEEKSEIPTQELQYPENFTIYYTHLESLGLITWPVLKQDPIIINGNQKGVRRFSKLLLTDFGKSFVKACVPNDEYVKEKFEEISRNRHVV